MPNTPTLPGVRVTLSDSYYSANDTNPDSQRVLIIAAGGDGATAALYNPIQYASEMLMKTACGEGSDAHIAYVQALRSGATNIYVAIVDGTVAVDAEGRESELVKALAYADTVEPDLIVPFGFYANEVIPGTNVTVTKNITAAPAGALDDIAVTITTTTAHTFSEGDSVTLTGLLPNKLNGVKVIEEIISPTKFVISFTPALDAEDVLDLAAAAATAVKTTVTGSTLSENAKNLGVACHLMTRDLTPCLGVMALAPLTWAGDLPTATEVGAWVDAVVAAKLVSITDEDFAPIANVTDSLGAVTVDSVATDLGKYIALFAGSVIVRGQAADADTSAVEYTSGEAVAAGQIYSTPLEAAITSSPLTNVIGIPNNFSRAQKLALITKKVNPICQSSSGTIITLDGWTLAGDNEAGDASVYERVSTVRIVNEVIKSTRNELEKFIGMQASTARLNSIETKLRTVYNAYKQAGVLRNADFKIEYSQSTGTLTVNLNLVPFGEIREVSVTVSVQISA